jgi:hypothetical protein
MQTLYYLSVNGKHIGPFSLEEVLSKLEKQEVSWMDYLYDNFIQDWILILEYPALTQKFNAGIGRPNANPIIIPEQTYKSAENKLREKAWYTLKDGNNYGPYSYLEVIQMLQEKALFEFDFVWHIHLPAWKRVAEVSEFSPDYIKDLKDSGDVSLAEIFFRRRHVRAKYGCSLILHDNKSVYKGRTLEIGAGGAGIIVQTSMLQPGQNVFLHFQPGDGVPPFNAICNIVSKQFVKHPTDPQNSGVKYGVKFTSVSQSVKESIKSFAEKRTSLSGKAA